MRVILTRLGLRRLRYFITNILDDLGGFAFWFSERLGICGLILARRRIRVGNRLVLSTHRHPFFALAEGLCQIIMTGARLETGCDDALFGFSANDRLLRIRLDHIRIRLVLAGSRVFVDLPLVR